jgi:hypothetical protein
MRRRREKAGKKVTRRNAILYIYSAPMVPRSLPFERLYVILSKRGRSETSLDLPNCFWVIPN